MEEFKIPVPRVECVSAVIKFIKGFLERKGFEITPLLAEHLDHLDASVRAYVEESMMACDLLSESLVEAKKKVKSRLRQLDHLSTYDEQSKQQKYQIFTLFNAI